MGYQVLNQKLLDNYDFWKEKKVELPKYDRKKVPVKSVCFSAGKMAYGHIGDIMQDLLNEDSSVGVMIGIETFSSKYVTDLAVSDFLVTQLIYENEKDKATLKIQGAIKSLLFLDGSISGLAWAKLIELARNPDLQFGTINAPEGAYGVIYNGGEFATPINPILVKDMEEGTVNSDPAKWTFFALERYKAGLKFALISCTNFSGNGHYTAATVKTVAKAWVDRGIAPAGFLKYLSDPTQFSFPNCMIDRIAVEPDEDAKKIMNQLGIESRLVVTERARYWAVEDIFPAGRPPFEKIEGVFMEDSYEEIKKYEDMKLRILNMSQSTLASLGIILGYRGKYGVYKGIQDPDLRELIKKIISIVTQIIDQPKKMDVRKFTESTLERLNNPNIPDDLMRIALNASVKILPRFMDTYYNGLKKGLVKEKMDLVLVPVAGFIRYTMGLDDLGQPYDLADDPHKALLTACGSRAKLGDPASVEAFKELISHEGIMGKALYTFSDTINRLEVIVKAMLAGTGAVRKTIQAYLSI